MANCYTSFAESFKMPREAACFAIALDIIAREIGEDSKYEIPETLSVPIPGPDDPTIDVKIDDRLVLSARTVVKEHSDDYWGTATTFEVTECGLYIADDEGPDLEALAHILQITVAQFDLPPVSVTWADTCDKRRPGEFGGGAFIATKDALHWMGCHSWVREKLKELNDE